MPIWSTCKTYRNKRIATPSQRTSLLLLKHWVDDTMNKDLHYLYISPFISPLSTKNMLSCLRGSFRLLPSNKSSMWRFCWYPCSLLQKLNQTIVRQRKITEQVVPTHHDQSFSETIELNMVIMIQIRKNHLLTCLNVGHYCGM